MLERKQAERQIATDKATQLFEAATDRYSLFRDKEGGLYAQFDINGHAERHALGSEAFKADLNLLAFEAVGLHSKLRSDKNRPCSAKGAGSLLWKTR